MTHPNSNKLQPAPHSPQAEQAVLGALMLNPDAWHDISGALRPEDFFIINHQAIFRAILRLSAKQRPFDVVTVADELDAMGKADDVGGLAYVGEIANNTPNPKNASGYADIVRQHADRRRLIGIATGLIENSRACESAPQDLVADTEAAFEALVRHDAGNAPETISQIIRNGYIDELQDRAEGKTQALSTNVQRFDHLTEGGLRPGQMIVIAARPGAGKTVLACNIASHAAGTLNVPVLFFSLEMSKGELVDRIVANECNVSYSAIRRGRFDTPDFMRHLQRVEQSPLMIDDAAGLSIQQIRSRAIQTQRRSDLGLVIIDYLQLVRTKAGNRFEEISAVSRLIKQMAKELRVPVIALSQMNRDIESRIDKEPRLSDLRESGQMEQDADIVAFLYQESDAPKDVITMKVAKHRNGLRGDFRLHANFDRMRFEPYNASIPPPQQKASGFRYNPTGES